MKFCIIDVSNLVHRAKHVVNQSHANTIFSIDDEEQDFGSIRDKIGLILTVIFKNINKASTRFETDHIVACFDSYSWRKEIFKGYKKSREISNETEDERLMIKQSLEDLYIFFNTCTNVTALRCEGIEADDFIGRWISLHNDETFNHIIFSSDSDFKQLVSPNVELFSPINNSLYTTDGIFFQDGKKVQKTDDIVYKYKETWKVKYDKHDNKIIFNPEWELFLKCIRGDRSDSIPSAYPRIRTKKLERIFQNKGGKEWINFMHETWTYTKDIDEEPKSVKKCYELNKLLIDLRNQPKEIIKIIDNTIYESLNRKPKKLIGAYFARLCSKYGMIEIQRLQKPIIEILTRPYLSS